MAGNKTTPTAPAEAHQTVPSYHHDEDKIPSTRPSSSSSSHATPCDDEDASHVQGAKAASTTGKSAPQACNYPDGIVAANSEQDPDPYPLWSRPAPGTAFEEAPRRPSSLASLPAALCLSSLSLSAASSPRTAVPPAKALPARRVVGCQHPGCSTAARYGPIDAPRIACQAHKRAGQYTTNRHGVMFKATRDGDAFRTPVVVAAGSPPSSGTTGTMAASDQSRPPSKSGSSNSSFSPRSMAAAKSFARAQTLKRVNRPGLSGEDEVRSPPWQDRPCLFPGCNARPEYGLAGATRAVYCFTHKKGPMVLLFKGTPGLRKAENAKSAPVVVARAPAPGTVEKKTAQAPIKADEKAAKKARLAPKARGGDDAPVGIGKNSSNTSRDTGEKERHGTVSGPDMVDGDLTSPIVIKTSISHLPSPAAAATSAPAKPLSPPTNRWADKSGMAPSVEFLLLRQAREAAKKEAEASGGGRRPRAPSRRALEASGRLKNDGVQWMTREKKAEEVRFNTELRKQRKQYREAGLKSGVVLETFVEAGATGAAGGGINGVDVGEIASWGATPPQRSGSGWQKVSPAALLASSGQVKEQRRMTSVALEERLATQARPTAPATSA